MFDQKNVNVKQVGWGLACIYLALAHYLFTFVQLDVLHLYHKQFTIPLFDKTYTFTSPIKDLFLFHDAQPGETMSVRWYVFLLSMWLIVSLQSYINLYTYGALRVCIVHEIRLRLHTHKQVYRFRQLCLAFWLYCLLSFILTAGQYLPLEGTALYIAGVYLIFYFQKEDKWQVKNKEE